VKIKVYIKDVQDINQTILQIFEESGLRHLKGKRIFIKPNMLRIAQPDDCIITAPSLINAVVGYLIGNSANVVVGDNPIPQAMNEVDVSKKCGFFEASRGRFKNIGKYVRKIRLRHKDVKEIYVSRDVLDSDFLISLPKFKVHELTILSIAIKNQFGIIPGGLKPGLHYQCPTLDDFCRLLIEVYNIKVPNLIIVDALNIRDARSRFYPLNKLIISNNAWAVEYVCSLMVNLKPEINPLLRIALRDKLFDPDQLEIIGQLETIRGFALPIYFPIKNFFAGIGSRVFAKLHSYQVPTIDHSLCNKCHSCENVCPVRAVRSFNIYQKKCIKCYCCFEVCPQNAIKRRLRII
jgi:uncharacterized protein (DUF362 family)/NAD-dependent dihydropyrimidine dehydrogenase PreA subunit